MENNHISLRHKVKMYEFLVAFEKCDTEKFLNAAYLPLEFSIIL